ncbi:MAG: Diguanylate cyclase [Parcubacteria group bacterium GW2011_GWC2_38_7]|nr:MAG: Diguanylate cyclase [Parcubacteria group bacterium GW2011_GWC2_38_7]
MKELFHFAREIFGSVPTWAMIIVILGLIVALALFSRKLWKIKEHLKERVENLERELLSWHRDLLTGLLSRRMWQEEFRRMFNVAYKRIFDKDGAQRAEDASQEQRMDHSRQLALISLDIDHFKHVNDNYGHATGDVVLSKLGELINMIVRPGDLAGRIGGEEFSIALNTDVFGAQAFLRRLRKLLAMQQFIAPNGTTFTVTISAGAVQLVLKETSIEKLMLRADELLYEAKNGGRNCYVLQECSGTQRYEH